MATRMQQRRGTAAQWTEADPILAAGEIGFETDTSQFKIGDGTNVWSELSYFQSLDSLGGTFDDYVPLNSKGQPDGVASLDVNGQIPVSQLGNIIDGANAALDTLNELATALGNDEEFANTVTNGITNNAANITTLSNTVNGILSDVSDLNDGAASTALALDGISTNITNLQNTTNTLETDLGQLQTDYSTVTAELADKADLDSPTFIGTVILPSATSIGDVSATEIAYVNGVTSAIQTQLDGKLESSVAASTYAPLSAPTFTGNVSLPSTTTIGTVDGTELAYLNGVTSAVQTQLDAKAPIESPTFTGTVSGITKAMVGLGSVDNTADADKPVSTATQTALDAKASLAGATFTGDVTVETDLIVDGNLTVSGTTTTVSAQDLVVSDPLIYIGEGNTANLVDLGLVSSYNDGTYQHSGIVRDSSDNKWKIFKGVTDEPTTTINFAQGSLDNLAVNNVEVAGVVFSDGTQTKQGVPSITTISQKTDSYTLGALTERDTIIEISKASATTLTIPTDATLNFPVGTTLDIIQTGAGQVTIAGAGGVTVNGTPGLKLRTQWSSATLLKRAANTWLVYGDLTA